MSVGGSNTLAKGGKDALLKFGNGFASAEAVTFQNTGDTVTYNAHGLLAGQIVRFATVVTTTTITSATDYYVVNPLTNTFQVSLTPGGSAVAVDADGTGTMSEGFQTLALLKEFSIALESGAIDITNNDSSQWKELLDAAGISSASISASGVGQYGVTFDVVKGLFLNRTIRNWRLFVDGSTKYFSGCFRLASLELSQPHDDAQTFSASLESNGAISYTSS